jgi:transcriptional regulator with XRE-family HTH domain
MKKEPTLTTLLGITQQQAAMLLGVSRSQWSMFELGKRDLPLPAKQLLAEMLAHVQPAETLAKNAHVTPLVTPQQCESLLRENEFQRLLVMRKITTATQKQQAQDRLGQLASFLRNHDKGKAIGSGFSEAIVHKAAKNEANGFLDNVALLQHRLQVLDYEKQLLLSRME